MTRYEWPISEPNLQLFQSFPTEVTQNDSEWPISPDLQLFQSIPTSSELGMANFTQFATFPIYSH